MYFKRRQILLLGLVPWGIEVAIVRKVVGEAFVVRASPIPAIERKLRARKVEYAPLGVLD